MSNTGGVDVDVLVGTYGYAAIVLGTVFEGEATMLAAGAAAHRGLLSAPLVLGAGMLGTFISDTCCFGAGRYCGRWLARVFPNTMARVDAVLQRVASHRDRLIVCHQFIPGMCTITPLAVGMSSISTTRFLLLNLAGNFLWTSTYTLAGYTAATAWNRLPALAGMAGTKVVIAIVVVLLLLIVRSRSAIRQARHGCGPDESPRLG